VGALETYLSAVRDTKLSGEGVSELSYYPALHALLEEVGGKLKPKVRCFMNLRNQGAGLPDGGLFTADQVRGSRAATGADLRRALLGRDLKPEEVREVSDMARRIAAILLLQPALDGNYLAVKGDTWEWKAQTHRA